MTEIQIVYVVALCVGLLVATWCIAWDRAYASGYDRGSEAANLAAQRLERSGSNCTVIGYHAGQLPPSGEYTAFGKHATDAEESGR